MAQHETWVSSTCECPESNLDLVQPTWHSEYPISVTKQPSSGGKVSRTFRNHGGDCKRFCRHIRTSRGRHQVFAFAGLAAGPEIRLRLTGQSPESSEKRSDQRVSVPQIQFSSLSSFTKGRVRTDSLEEIYLPLDWVQSTTDAIERVFDCNKQIRPRNNCIELGFQGSCAARLRVISEEHVSRQCIRSHVRQSERRGYSAWRRVNIKALNSTPPNLNDSVLQCTDEIGKIGPKHVNRVDKHWSWE